MSHDIDSINSLYEDAICHDVGKLKEILDTVRDNMPLLTCRDTFGDTLLDLRGFIRR